MSISPFQLKKSLHINLNKDTHAELRVSLFRRGLSMQEVFEFLAVKIIDGDQNLNNFLDQLEYNKKNKTKQKKLNSTDAKSIFDAIENESPWEK